MSIPPEDRVVPVEHPETHCPSCSLSACARARQTIWMKPISSMRRLGAVLITPGPSRRTGDESVIPFFWSTINHFIPSRPDLMVKKLRYYARFIVVCLLLKKMKLVRELVVELEKQIVEYTATWVYFCNSSATTLDTGDWEERNP